MGRRRRYDTDVSARLQEAQATGTWQTPHFALHKRCTRRARGRLRRPRINPPRTRHEYREALAAANHRPTRLVSPPRRRVAKAPRDRRRSSEKRAAAKAHENHGL